VYDGKLKQNNVQEESVAMKLNRVVAICGAVGVLCLGAGSVWAQSGNSSSNNAGQDQGGQGGRGRGGNFDPAQFQQRFMENIKDRLAFTNDTDWAAVQPLVQKIFDARRDVGFGGGFGRFGGRGGGDNAGRRNAFNQPSPEADALQKALDDNVPAAQVKNLLEKYRASRKDKQAKLEQAQEDLRKVLSTRQEAQAVLLGLLN
jgi:hypothetical protein